MRCAAVIIFVANILVPLLGQDPPSVEPIASTILPPPQPPAVVPVLPEPPVVVDPQPPQPSESLPVEGESTTQVSGFQPITLRPFSQLAHGLKSGPITIIDPRTFFIADLHYDGKGPDAHFWAGVGPHPTANGILVPDDNGSTEPLSAYIGQNVTIKLPPPLTFDQIDYFGVWCIKFKHDFGHTIVPSKTRGVQLLPFKELAHGLRSGPIVLVDKKTIYVPNLHYDGKGPDAHFWVGKGSEPSSQGILVADENGSTKSLSAYTGQNIYIRLPDGVSTDNIDYFGVWCIEYKHNFGHVLIPKDVDVPENDDDPLHTYDNKTIVRIQKCCPASQVLLASGCQEDKQKFDPIIDVYEHNSTHINNVPLVAQSLSLAPFVNHITCQNQKYPLYPDEDKFLLLQNGSLLVLRTQQVLSQDSYCMETVNFGDDTDKEWVTTAIVCFTSSANNPISSTLFIIYAIGIMVSAIFLIVTAVIFVAVKEVSDTRGKCVVFYSLSLAAAFICLASAQFSGIDDKTCAVIGFIVQFFLVSSFTCLTLITWETHYKIRNYGNNSYSRDRKRLYVYLGLGLFFPIATSLISFVVDNIPGIPHSMLKPQFGKNSCWFDQKRSTTLYFYIPIGIAIVINLILGVLMKINLLWCEKHRKDDISWITIKSELKPMFRSCTFLLLVMILCWLMEIISFVVQGEGGIWIAIDIINSLQGLIVFIIFVLHNPVRSKLCKRNKRDDYEDRFKDVPLVLLPKNGNSYPNHHDDFLTKLHRVESIENIT